MTEHLTQIAPYPVALNLILAELTYRPRWNVYLEDMRRGQGSEGLTLVVDALVQDSRAAFPTDDQMPLIRVHHLFPVPPAAYNMRSWRRWVFDRLLEVERHEAAEFFVVDGERPFAPLHGPGNDPYMVVEATPTEARTNNRGEVTQPG